MSSPAAAAPELSSTSRGIISTKEKPTLESTSMETPLPSTTNDKSLSSHTSGSSKVLEKQSHENDPQQPLQQDPTLPMTEGRASTVPSIIANIRTVPPQLSNTTTAEKQNTGALKLPPPPPPTSTIAGLAPPLRKEVAKLDHPKSIPTATASVSTPSSHTMAPVSQRPVTAAAAAATATPVSLSFSSSFNPKTINTPVVTSTATTPAISNVKNSSAAPVMTSSLMAPSSSSSNNNNQNMNSASRKRPYRRTKKPKGYCDKSTITTATDAAMTPVNVYDAVLGEAEDLLTAAMEAQALGRLKMASAYQLLSHARLVGLGKRFDRAPIPEPPTSSFLSESLVSSSSSSSVSSPRHHFLNDLGTKEVVTSSGSKFNATTASTPSSSTSDTVKLPPQQLLIHKSAAISPTKMPSSTAAASVVGTTPKKKVVEKGHPPEQPRDEGVDHQDDGGDGGEGDEMTCKNKKSRTTPQQQHLVTDLARFLPSNIEVDTIMMEHLARAAVELHRQRTGKKISAEGLLASPMNGFLAASLQQQQQQQSTPTTVVSANSDVTTCSVTSTAASSGNSGNRSSIRTIHTNPNSLSQQKTTLSSASSGVAWSEEEKSKVQKALRQGTTDPIQIAKLLGGTRTESQVKAYLRNHMERVKGTANVEEDFGVDNSGGSSSSGGGGGGANPRNSGGGCGVIGEETPRKRGGRGRKPPTTAMNTVPNAKLNARYLLQGKGLDDDDNDEDIDHDIEDTETM